MLLFVFKSFSDIWYNVRVISNALKISVENVLGVWLYNMHFTYLAHRPIHSCIGRQFIFEKVLQNGH